MVEEVASHNEAWGNGIWGGVVFWSATALAVVFLNRPSLSGLLILTGGAASVVIISNIKEPSQCGGPLFLAFLGLSLGTMPAALLSEAIPLWGEVLVEEGRFLRYFAAYMAGIGAAVSLANYQLPRREKATLLTGFGLVFVVAFGLAWTTDNFLNHHLVDLVLRGSVFYLAGGTLGIHVGERLEKKETPDK